ncbi:GFA family protein [Rhizobium sp. NFR03]|uniref:GFA family protein n=1 Tax=Rhizobium sp. NFR03 TaxID=1566263 RepID=UPI0008C6A50A|nr:GFA family protein [Rhizobium sp. NFR03]SES27128.1 Uncharacterized conserved protein [Rhizobium sp. NFR03]
MTVREGSCRCGNVRFRVAGEPLRVGICHCTDCRRESGSAFAFFGIWPASAFEGHGETVDYAERRFCPACGSRLFSLNDEEAEIKLGSLTDAPSGLAPSYELWTKRRETWLAALPGTEQFDEDRVSPPA